MDADAGPSGDLAGGEVGEAPGSLRLIEEFVNSVELPDGEDLLGSVASAREWLARRGVVADLDETSRAGLVALREAMRDLLEANAGNAVRQDSLNLVMHRLNDTRLAVVITAEGAHAHPAPEEQGIADFLGRLGAAMITASVYGTWQRLKTCHNDECRWAFYDKSKNARRVWCSMASCGCREKSRSYRARKKAAPVDATR
jgi:predicted RNA-binding Zn ribbon-like protein